MGLRILLYSRRLLVFNRRFRELLHPTRVDGGWVTC